MSAAGSGPRIASVNVGSARLLTINGVPVKTGIYKQPVEGRVGVSPNGVEGDRIADLTVHGGWDKAVYAYAIEDYAWWADLLGIETPPGLFGENLTLAEVDTASSLIGERWRVGEALLEVSEPRQPCSKLAAKMGDPRFVRAFAKAMRLGAYLRVIEPGTVAAGDSVEVIERPDHDVSIGLLSRILFDDPSLAPRALAAPALTDWWREMAERRAASQTP